MVKTVKRLCLKNGVCLIHRMARAIRESPLRRKFSAGAGEYQLIGDK